MNRCHKLIDKHKDKLTKKEVTTLCNLSIEDYAKGYTVADENSNDEKRNYFKWRISQVCELTNQIIY